MEHGNARERDPPRGIVRDFLRLLRAEGLSLHALIVYRAGEVLYSQGWHNVGTQEPHAVYSVSKAFAATAIGMLVDRGRVSEDDRVAGFFPEYAGEIHDERVKEITVGHLLDMRSGHGECTFDRLNTGTRDDWLGAWFGLPLRYPPGSFFCYDAALTYVLGRIVHRVTGANLLEYLRDRLFAPLGIARATWEVCPRGYPLAGMGLSLSASDLLKFCVLYLQKGIYQDRRILSERWVASVSLNDRPGLRGDTTYNHHFFIDPPDVYTAAGAFGQFGIVVPHREAVIVTLGGEPDYWRIKRHALDVLVRGLDGQAGIPAGAPGGRSARAAGGRRDFRFDPRGNSMGISRIVMDLGTEIVLSIVDGRGEHSLRFRDGQPEAQQSGWLVRERMGPIERIVADYAWTAGDILTLRIQFVEMAYEVRIRCVFSGARLYATVRPNLSVDRVGLWLRMPTEGLLLVSED